MPKITTTVLLLFLACGALANPVEDPDKDKDVKEIVSPVFHANVAVPVQDEGFSIPVQVIHEVGRSIDNNDVNSMHVTNREVALVEKLKSKCNDKDLSSCVMLKLVSYMNRLLKKSSLEVYDGLEITQTSAIVEEIPQEESARAGESEETLVARLVTEKLWNFARSRSVRWNVLGDADLVFSTTADEKGALKLGVNLRESKSLGEGRGKNKNMGPLLAAAAMKIGMVGALAFKGLALLVFKAILVAKIALLLAGVIGLGKLFSQEKHTTYEVVAHPHHSSSHGHSSGGGGGGGGDHGDEHGWGRSVGVGDAQELAYKAHAPQ